MSTAAVLKVYFCPNCVRWLPKSLNDSTYVRPAAAYSSCQEYSSIRIRPSCVRRDWSDSLEHTAQRPAWSRIQHRQLRSPIDDALVPAVCGALGAL